MKFKMDGALFKRSVDRVIDVAKAAVIHESAYIKIEAKDGSVSFAASVLNCSGKVWVDAEIIEEGTAYVFLNDLKKVYAMGDWLTVSATQSAFMVQNRKKRSQVPCSKIEENTYFSADLEKLLFVADSDSLLHSLEITDQARNLYEVQVTARECMEGFHFDGKNRRIIATDGFRMHAAKLDMQDENGNYAVPFEKTVHGCLFAHLKKIIGKRSAGNVSVYDAERYVAFTGADFDYRVCIYEAVYPKVFELLPKDYEYAFTVSTKEMLKVAKEYSKVKAEAMYLSCCAEDMVAAMESPDYRTADCIESYADARGMESEKLLIINPIYVAHAMLAFDDETVRAYGHYKTGTAGLNNRPTVFENDELLVLILPVIAQAEKLRVATQLIAETRDGI